MRYFNFLPISVNNLFSQRPHAQNSNTESTKQSFSSFLKYTARLTLHILYSPPHINEKILAHFTKNVLETINKFFSSKTNYKKKENNESPFSYFSQARKNHGQNLAILALTNHAFHPLSTSNTTEKKSSISFFKTPSNQSTSHSTRFLDQPSAQKGYSDKNLAVNCGHVSLNSFLQKEQFSIEDSVKKIITDYENFDLIGAQKKLPGIHHPKILAAMKKGESITIQKDEFLKNANTFNETLCWDVLYVHTPQEQWNQLNKTAWSNQVTITPQDWFTAFGGFNADLLENTLNQHLNESSKNTNQIHNSNRSLSVNDFLPNSVCTYQLTGFNTENLKSKQLSASTIEAQLERIAKAQQIQFGTNHVPIICMAGGGSGSLNHYFALFKDKTGDWISQDSLLASKKGPQTLRVFAKKGQLASTLAEKKVLQVICQPLDAAHMPMKLNRSASI